MQSNSARSSQRRETVTIAEDVLISPIATLIASEPSATTTHRQPRRMSNVSIILAVIGLSSASKHVTALSCGSGILFRSTDATDDGDVWISHLPVSCEVGADHASDCEPSPLVETDAVLSRLGIEFRR